MSEAMPEHEIAAIHHWLGRNDRASMGPAGEGIARRLLAEVTRLRAELADAVADATAFKPAWSSPYAQPKRWTTEPNPHPRRYVSTHQAQQDYADSIRCASDWPPEKRHEAVDRALHRIPDLCYEIEHLAAELAAAAEREQAAKADAWDKGYASGHNDGVCNADRNPNPYRASLDGPEGDAR
jgi:hypothetical protein